MVRRRLQSLESMVFFGDREERRIQGDVRFPYSSVPSDKSEDRSMFERHFVSNTKSRKINPLLLAIAARSGGSLQGWSRIRRERTACGFSPTTGPRTRPRNCHITGQRKSRPSGGSQQSTCPGGPPGSRLRLRISASSGCRRSQRRTQ